MNATEAKSGCRELVTRNYATDHWHPFSLQLRYRPPAPVQLVFSAQGLIKLDPISFRILDPREFPVVEILGLLDLDPVGPQLLEERLEVSHPVVDDGFPTIRRRGTAGLFQPRLSSDTGLLSPRKKNSSWPS